MEAAEHNEAPAPLAWFAPNRVSTVAAALASTGNCIGFSATRTPASSRQNNEDLERQDEVAASESEDVVRERIRRDGPFVAKLLTNPPGAKWMAAAAGRTVGNFSSAGREFSLPLDGLYNLLRFACSNTDANRDSLFAALDPIVHSPDASDSSLSFFLCLLLFSLSDARHKKMLDDADLKSRDATSKRIIELAKSIEGAKIRNGVEDGELGDVVCIIRQDERGRQLTAELTDLLVQVRHLTEARPHVPSRSSRPPPTSPISTPQDLRSCPRPSFQTPPLITLYRLAVSFADELESDGDLKRAMTVLILASSMASRASAGQANAADSGRNLQVLLLRKARSMLDRHVPHSISIFRSEEGATPFFENVDFLLNELGVPLIWVRAAVALRASNDAWGSGNASCKGDRWTSISVGLPALLSVIRSTDEEKEQLLGGIEWAVKSAADVLARIIGPPALLSARVDARLRALDRVRAKLSSAVPSLSEPAPAKQPRTFETEKTKLFVWLYPRGAKSDDAPWGPIDCRCASCTNGSPQMLCKGKTKWPFDDANALLHALDTVLACAEAKKVPAQGWVLRSRLIRDIAAKSVGRGMLFHGTADDFRRSVEAMKASFDAKLKEARDADIKRTARARRSDRTGRAPSALSAGVTDGGIGLGTICGSFAELFVRGGDSSESLDDARFLALLNDLLEFE